MTDIAGFTACNKQETPASDDKGGTDENNYFVGLLRAGESFSIPDAQVDVILSEDQTRADIFLLGVSFAEGMPAVKLRLPAVPVSVSNGKIIFEWSDTENAITPNWIKPEEEVPYPAYKITKVNGTIEPDASDAKKENCSFSNITFVGTNPSRPSTIEIHYQGSRTTTQGSLALTLLTFNRLHKRTYSIWGRSF